MISRHLTGRLAKHSPGYDEVFVTITIDNDLYGDLFIEEEIELRVTGCYAETTGGVHPSGEVERLDDTEIDEVSVQIGKKWMQIDQKSLSNDNYEAIIEALQESERPE